MKKLLSIAAMAIFVIALSSCTKEIECECTTTLDGVDMGTTTYTIEDKKPDCADLDTETTSAGFVTKMTCVEK